MRQLTSLDAQFLAAEDGAVYGHVTGLAIYDVGESRKRRSEDSRTDGDSRESETGHESLESEPRHLTRDDVRDIVAARLHLVPPFRRRLVEVPLGLDLPYWVEDPDFDLEDHIRAHELPAPGGHIELADYVGQVMGEPLDLTKPPWAIDVISGLKGGRVAVATRIHHSASDGLAMAEMFAIMHDRSAAGRDLAGRAFRPERVPSRPEMLVRGLAGIPKQPARFVKSFPRAMPHLDQVVTLRGLPGVPGAAALSRRIGRVGRTRADGDILPGPTVLAPRTRTSGMVSPRRAVGFTTTPLGEVKTIKNHFSVSVNDVIMAIVGGALHRWLSRHDDLPSDPLAAMVPVSVRVPSHGTFGNAIAMMIPPVYSNEADPARRLMLTHEAMRVAKERHRAVPATLLQDANHFIPPMLLARAARATALVGTSPRRSRAAANLLISNIPGAREPQYMGGCRLIAHFPLSAIFHGMGLNVTIVSYGDQIDWGITLDPEQIDDAWGLCDDIRQAQAELLALTGAATPAAVPA